MTVGIALTARWGTKRRADRIGPTLSAGNPEAAERPEPRAPDVCRGTHVRLGHRVRGAPVLALHGWARSHRGDFDAVVSRETGTDRCPALALDLPGFGASPPPPAAWGAEAYAEQVAGVVDDMGSPGRAARALLRRPGGPAPRRPAPASSGPRCSPACRCRLRGCHQWCRLRTSRSGVCTRCDGLRRCHGRARQRYGSADYKAAQGIMREGTGPRRQRDLRGAARRRPAPVHLVWGGDDTAAPLQVAEPARAPGPRRPGRPSRGGSSDPAAHPRCVASHRGVMSELVGALVCALALFPAGARWLRVAQREHYLPGSTTRFAWRWWGLRPPAPALAVVALAGAAVAFAFPLVSLATAAVVVVGPPALGVRGRTAPLVFTRRMRLLAAVWLVLQAVVIGIGILVHHAAALAALGACAVPLVVDAAAALLSPIERRLATPMWRRRRPAWPRWHPRWWRSPGRSARRRPSNMSRTCWRARARWWPARRRSTTGPGWHGPSTSNCSGHRCLRGGDGHLRPG